MERDHKMMMSTKYVCKICNKWYPCGKSLGGHLKSHRIGAGLVDEDYEFNNYDKKGMGSEVGGSSGYGLRANPKKTRRFRDSNSIAFRHPGYGNVCKECGKGFPSMKALCGHMACHSEKEKVSDSFEEEDDEDDEDDENEDEDEEEEEDHIDQLVQQNKKFKFSMGSEQSSGYSSVSEIEQEQEELAMCLMMLSRDNRGSRIPNSSGSLVLETKSSPVRIRVRATEGLNTASKFGETMDMKKLQSRDRKLKSAEIPVGYEKSRYGHLMYDEDCNSSIDEQVKIKEFAKPRMARKFTDAVHLGKKLEKKIEYPTVRKRVRNNSESPEVVSSRAGGTDFTSTDSKLKHQCDVCYKLFDSRKALSGHKSASSCYRKVPTFCPSDPNREPTRPWDNKKPNINWKKKQVTTKKSYKHECPICFRVFKSGQALGGHKRSHFLGSSEDRTMTIEGRDINKVQGLIDLNLPAPLEEDVPQDSRFVPC